MIHKTPFYMNIILLFNTDISERTVKAHLASIYQKLGVDSRAAIAVAAQKGMLQEK